MNRKRLILCLPLVLAALVIAGWTAEAAPFAQATATAAATSVSQTAVAPATAVVTSTIAAPSPGATETISQTGRTISATVGAGVESVAAIGFYPATLKVHVGDTIKWTINSDELHTVTFSDGKAPPGNDPAALLQDPRPDAVKGDVVPNFPAPIKGGGPTDFQFNPVLALPSRAPGAPIETWDGTGYANSGALSKQPSGPPGTPPNDSFSLTFTKPGIYHYLCLIHLGQMIGTVEVVPTTDTDVPTQAEIDTQTKAESDAILSLIDKAVAAVQTPVPQPLPDKTNLVFVSAGVQEGETFIGLGQSMSFGPKDVTIKAGDTIVWNSSYFHTVTFNPAPPPPDFIIPKPQPQGPPLLVINPQVLFPVKPSQVYDPSKYYNSGTLTPGGPFGTSFSLTFDKPGVYPYFCAVHYLQGMKGTITVTK